MNKNKAAIARAVIDASRPSLAFLFAVIAKLPWRSIIGIGSATALGPSFRWGDDGG
jgi:hypothetical protein